jgi:uncharacterized integral membrane protein (TIGR00698 family)
MKILKIDPKILFFVGLIVSASGAITAPVALAAGLVFGLTFAHPYHVDCRNLSKFLLKASVVGLGFGMNLQEVLKAGRSGIALTALTITLVLVLGWLLGRALRVPGTPAFLITAGTAICGGSAIAAVGPILKADDEEMAVALGTVFILNSIALLIFPPIGWALKLTQAQFGLWAALAIHDTSSVVGAAARYGAAALVVGTTVKLARALWIVPLALGTAAVKKSSGRIQLPWFILFFCLAAVVNTYVPAAGGLTKTLATLGRLGLVATLYLIGTGLSRATIKQVGVRPLVQGVLLWIVVATGSLWLVWRGLLAL